MNITAILLIAVIGIMFLVLEITLINLLIDSIRDKDLFLSGIGGLTLIGVCLLEILTFVTICPELKQDRYTDCQVEQKVIETKETGGWLLANNISTDANDYCNKNHLDHRGLIEKGLAINATGLNIY